MQHVCKAQARFFWKKTQTPSHAQSYQCKKTATTWAEYKTQGFLRAEGEPRAYLQPTCELHSKDKAAENRTISSRAELASSLRMGTAKGVTLQEEVAMPIAHRCPGIALRSHETGPTYYAKCSCGVSFEFDSRAQVVVALNAHCREVN